MKPLTLVVAFFLSGCVSQSTQPLNGAQTSDLTLSVNENNKNEKEPVASFEPDTVYDLMVAEIGGQRSRYDLALGNYLKQAHKTQDAGIAERAYQIAMFVGARQAALDASLLWSDLEPGNVKALQAVAVELVNDGDQERAVIKMKGILALNGEAEFDGLAASAAEVSPEERQQLMTTFKVIQKEYPDNRELLLGMAILHRQSGEDDQALALTNQLLNKNPDYIKAMIVKGRILNKLGRGDEAEKMLLNAVKRHPDKARLRLLYARVLVHGKKLDEARKEFEVLLKQSPHDGEILLSLALVTMENEMYQESEQYFNRLLALVQYKNSARYYLGRLKEKQKDLDAAQKYYLEVGAGKHFMMSQVSLTQMLVKQDKSEEAISIIAEARVRNPARAEELFLLESEVLVTDGQKTKALALLSKGVDYLPKSINLLYSRAMLHEKMNNLPGLEADLKKLLSIEPDNAAALNALGYTLADRTDRYKEAEALVLQAYELDSQDPSILDSMGWVQYKLGNLKEAAKYLRMAYKQYPDPEVAAHLGEVLWVMGDRDEAELLWENTLKESPHSSVLKETIERFRKQEQSTSSEAVSVAH
ncbi:hypothetical protein ACH42_06120 [Endozoicomonas sp. (ex Bugula neritina AB1)]|nr:hypothetical protein ACH42_06120 [Endozoicomonas sp. (ex Bugula neritina AB1)]